MNKVPGITSKVIYSNNAIDIVHDACKLCYKGKSEDTIENTLSYIENKVKLQHESVLEHSNLVILLTDTEGNFNTLDYSRVLEAGKHINAVSKTKGLVNYYLLGGNLRAFKNIFRNLKDSNNVIARAILNELYYVPKQFFHDFIEAGIMDERSFIDPVAYYYNTSDIATFSKNTPTFNIESIDRIDLVYNRLKNITEEELFNMDDLLDMCTTTIYFKKMSRIVTQQLTRHRNAISQQSQRYVDEKNAEFISPSNFKSELDDIMVSIDKYANGELTLTEVGDIMSSIYTQLRSQGILKEDARYYLPQGIKSELYVTFTLRNLIHFLSLRTHKSAQAEIRMFAIDILNIFEEYITKYIGKDIFAYLIPKYMLEEINYDYEELIENIE